MSLSRTARALLHVPQQGMRINRAPSLRASCMGPCSPGCRSAVCLCWSRPRPGVVCGTMSAIKQQRNVCSGCIYRPRVCHQSCNACVCVLLCLPPSTQMLVGFARPSASAPTRRRHIWDLVHTTLGRASMLIGIANVALGVTIFCQFFDGDFSMWAAWCAAALGAISLVQYVFDRQGKNAPGCVLIACLLYQHTPGVAACAR